MDREKKRGRGRERSVFQVILYTKLVALCGEILLLIFCLYFCGVPPQWRALCVLMVSAVGLCGSILAARRLAGPIGELSAAAASAQSRGKIPTLPPTGIRELDRFSSTVMQLSRDVLDNSTKFLRIMEMASVELAGYELRRDRDSVYVTDNFFPLLGMPKEETEHMTVERFQSLLGEAEKKYRFQDSVGGGDIYRVPQKTGGERYLRLETTCEGGIQMGLLEDVTAATQEKLRIEQERDYDLLTGLYSRRAFQRKCEALFAAPEKLGCAALLMLDLDGLKHVNDTFGHDWGDQYICRTGQCFGRCAPERAVCARISGDEFCLLLYGYDGPEAIRRDIDRIREEFHKIEIRLPSGRKLHISISGGLAWYPKDSAEFSTLKKYADFAMYQVKHSGKGRLGEFDLAMYNREQYYAQSREELHRLVNEELVSISFQPMVSVSTGRVEAYEALMRVDLPTLHTPAAVLRLAKEEKCLDEVERIALFRAAEAFCQLEENGAVRKESKLFVNSFVGTTLDKGAAAEFADRFAPLLPRMVLEVEEDLQADLGVLEEKRKALGGVEQVALDRCDGTADRAWMARLAPRYVKISRELVRELDTDPVRQKTVRSLADLAHSRGMQVVAVGVENAAQLRRAAALGADLVQGIYLAHPMVEPGPLNPAALSVLHSLRKEEIPE